MARERKETKEDIKTVKKLKKALSSEVARKFPTIRNEDRPIKDLIPDAKNSRTHSNRQINLLAESIKKYGFTNPVLVWKGNKIIAGHARVIAAEKAGLKSVPVRVCDHLTDSERRALVIADNKLAMVDFEWDIDNLKEEIEFLKADGFDIDSIGFDDKEMEGILSDFAVGENDVEEEWKDMPEFKNPVRSHRHIIVHFANEEDVKKFFKALKQKYSEKAKSVWYPEVEQRDQEGFRWDKDEKKKSKKSK